MFYRELNEASGWWIALRFIGFDELSQFYIAEENGRKKAFFFCNDTFEIANISHVFWYNKPEGIEAEITDDAQARYYRCLEQEQAQKAKE